MSIRAEHALSITISVELPFLRAPLYLGEKANDLLFCLVNIGAALFLRWKRRRKNAAAMHFKDGWRDAGDCLFFRSRPQNSPFSLSLADHLHRFHACLSQN
jgi:hypothetical protein